MRTLFRSTFLAVSAICAFCLIARGKEPKLNAEDLVRKHLESLGSPQTLAVIRSRIVEGRARMKMETGELGPGASGLAAGTLSIASAGSKYKVALPFRYADYWGEELAYDGAKAEVGFAYIQQRSPFGDFIFRYDMILEEGLFGGALSTAWPLLQREQKKPKLDYVGLKTVGDQQAHVLMYRRKKGQADMRIELFFDTRSFRHLRTAYNLALEYDSLSPALPESQAQGAAVRSNGTMVTQAPASTPHDDAGRQGAHYRLEEYFGDFKTVDGVTLPGRWNIIFERASGNRTIQREYAVIIDKVMHDQPLDAKAFVIEKRKE